MPQVTVKRTEAVLIPLPRWLRRRVLIPDEKLGWIPFAVLGGLGMLRKGCRVIWSTSPPESAHLVGYLLHKLTGVPWVADFNNEWTDNPAYNFPGPLVKRLHACLEDLVIRNADALCTLSPAHKRLLQGRYPGTSKFYVIQSGYDQEEFPRLDIPRVKRPYCLITHTGSFYGVQMPVAFIRAVNLLVDEGEIPAGTLRIRFIGHLWEAHGYVSQLKVPYELLGYVSYRRIPGYLLDSDILLITLTELGERVIPNKVYEYMAVGRPILAVVPLGEVADLIDHTGTGIVVPPHDLDRIKQAICTLYRAWREGKTYHRPEWDKIRSYNVRDIVRRLAEVLDHVSPS